MASADLLLHPVRLRVVQAFLGDRALTTTQLRAELPDVPAGSLYRHVARLVDGGVLAVVSERRVRGALERTYVLRASAAHLSLDEIAKMTPDEHRQAFLAFVAGLIGDADRYLARGDIDPIRDAHDGSSRPSCYPRPTPKPPHRVGRPWPVAASPSPSRTSGRSQSQQKSSRSPSSPRAPTGTGSSSGITSSGRGPSRPM